MIKERNNKIMGNFNNWMFLKLTPFNAIQSMIKNRRKTEYTRLAYGKANEEMKGRMNTRISNMFSIVI